MNGKPDWKVDHTGDPYAAYRQTTYCAGCGRWGDFGPFQCGVGMCRDCWLGGTEAQMHRAHRLGWAFILATFAGPWPLPIPK